MFFIRFCPLFQQKTHDFVRFSNKKTTFLSAFPTKNPLFCPLFQFVAKKFGFST